MHRIRLFEDLNAVGLKLEKHIDWIIETQMVGAIALGVDGKIETEPAAIERKRNDNPSSIVVVRGGGAGDLLFLTPGLRALREKFPNAHICVASRAWHHWILADFRAIDSQSDLPQTAHFLDRFDWIIAMEDTIEYCHDQHAIDIFAEKMGVKVADHRTVYKPILAPAEFEKECPKTKKRVGLQYAASTPVRTYPRMMELYRALQEKGWEVAILTAPGYFTLKTPMPDLIAIGDFKWSWSKATDFLQTCDFVIGPDSSMIHFASAMGIPGIGLYGSFDAKMRLTEGGSIEAIQATRECQLAPCFYHNGLGQLPPNGPCATARICTTLATISPDEIIAKMASMNF